MLNYLLPSLSEALEIVNGKPNWFQTLNESLNSEGLIETWNCFESISYGETKQWNFELDGKWYHGSITRETNGMYERPVWYGI